MNNKKRFKELGTIVEIPDLYVWVSDMGEWGVGELVVVDARDWTDEQFATLSNTPAIKRWDKAIEIATRNKQIKESDSHDTGTEKNA